MRTRSAVLAIVVAGVVSADAASACAQGWTMPAPTNLKVFDSSTPARDLLNTMKSFTRSLGVRCQHCHSYKGDNPDNLAAFDFASDQKTAKLTARTMIRMAASINADLLKGVGEAAPEGEAKVTCYTCHRGAKQPLTREPPKTREARHLGEGS